MPRFSLQGLFPETHQTPSPLSSSFCFSSSLAVSCFFFFSSPLSDNYLHRRRIISNPGNASLFSARCPCLPLFSEVVPLGRGTSKQPGRLRTERDLLCLRGKDRPSQLVRLCPLTAAISLGLRILQGTLERLERLTASRPGGVSLLGFSLFHLTTKGMFCPLRKC